MMLSVNPATGKEIARFDLQSAAEVDMILSQAVWAQAHWQGWALDARLSVLRKLAAELRAQIAQLAGMITLEMGKPIAEARAEIEKCALTCDFYADRAPEFLADEAVASSAKESLVAFEPLGVLLAVMPWNYPFWQALRFAVPALAAGNGVVLKHAPNVSQCALAIEELIRDAGAPDGLVRAVLVDVDAVAGLIADDRIAAITLTGSTRAGSAVASAAGKAIKRQVLELGGSDPFIVLADANIDVAAKAAVKARFGNCGQSCISAKRIILETAIADDFTERFVAEVAKLRTGDPMDSATTIGPLARSDLRDQLDRQVRQSLRDGGRALIGGAAIDGPGFFFQPTVIDDVTPDSTVFREETFGPVASLTRAPDADQAVALANRTEYGLGASLWTADLDRARRLARRVEAGAVFVNATVASDPRLPFGGIKRSGYGRELGREGLREFTNIKTVWIGADGA
jgi:succinate-semialdehyde dehydrogenase/glutarate-semialdehyde dehydrogenase